jgi:hypothetical protein
MNCSSLGTKRDEGVTVSDTAAARRALADDANGFGEPFPREGVRFS